MSIEWLVFSFEGRVGRQWFWIIWGLSILLPAGAWFISPLLGLIVGALLIWTVLAVGCKRFHDMGRTGWWLLIGGIPLVGELILLVWLGFVPGDPAENEYGPPDLNRAPSSLR